MRVLRHASGSQATQGGILAVPRADSAARRALAVAPLPEFCASMKHVIDCWTYRPLLVLVAVQAAAMTLAVLDARGDWAIPSGLLWLGFLAFPLALWTGLLPLASAYRRGRRRQAVSIALSLAIAAGLGVLGVIFMDTWRLTRDFDAITYRGDNGLCSVPPDGGGVAFCPRVDLDSPEFDPTGCLIVGDRLDGHPKAERAPVSAIVVADRRGAGIRTLAGSEGFRSPAWTPDGRSIFAASYDLSGVLGRWRWPENVRSLVPVLGLKAPNDRPIQFYELAFSPSGRRAVLHGHSIENPVIVDVSEDALTVRPSPALSFATISSPVWLDEQRLLLVGRTEAGKGAGLWEVEPETGATRRIATPGLSLGWSLALSPDRTAVVASAIETDGTQAWDLWRIELATGQVTRLPVKRHVSSMTWGR